MKVYKGLSRVKKVNFKTAVTLGVFDGVHLGHQKIIKEVVYLARNKRLKSVVVTFSPHPVNLTKNKEKLFFITTINQRIELINSLGVDMCVIVKFNKKFASQSAERFVKKILLDKLNMSYLVVSSDYRFGKAAKGDINLLRKLSKQLKFGLKEINMVKINNAIIKSTLIRNLLKQGKVAKVNSVLNRPYFLEGMVIEGRKIGSKIGFPTVNLKLNQDIALAAGVYAARIEFRKSNYKSVVNVGFNPTVSKTRKAKIVETHILDFNRNLYKQKVRVYFFKKIRDEKKFKDLEELRRAIKEDVKKTKQYFEKHRC